MPLDPSMIGSAAGTVQDFASNALKQFYGIMQLYQGMKGLKNLVRPEYQIDPNIKYNQQLAGQISSQGYGNAFLNNASDAINRNLGSTINAYTQTGQGLNAISGAQQNSNNAFQQLLMADAIQKSKNRDILMNANKDVSEENLRAFNWNKAIPYQLDYTKFTNMTNSGAQNIFGGQKGAAADYSAIGDAFSGMGNKTGSGDNYSTYNWNQQNDYYSQWLQQNQGFENPYPPGYGNYNQFK